MTTDINLDTETNWITITTTDGAYADREIAKHMNETCITEESRLGSRVSCHTHQVIIDWVG